MPAAARCTRLVAIALIPVLLLCGLGNVGAQNTAPGGLQIYYLSRDPSPNELAAAKRSLATGAVVFTDGISVIDFDGLLGVGVGSLRSREINPPAVAARIAQDGALHDFVYYQRSAGCDPQTAFNAWVDHQTSNDQSVPELWTQLSEDTVAYCSPNQNYMATLRNSVSTD